MYEGRTVKYLHPLSEIGDVEEGSVIGCVKTGITMVGSTGEVAFCLLPNEYRFKKELEYFKMYVETGEIFDTVKLDAEELGQPVELTREMLHAIMSLEKTPFYLPRLSFWRRKR